MRPTTSANSAIEEAITAVRQGLTAYRAVGAGLSLGLYVATLGSLESRLGRHQVALELFDEALRCAETSREEWVLPVIRARLDDAVAAQRGLGKGAPVPGGRRWPAAVGQPPPR